MSSRPDFAFRAVQGWQELLPELDTTPDELAVFIRLSRLLTHMDRLDERSLRAFEREGIRGIDDFLTIALMRRTPTGLSNTELIEQLGGSKGGMSARLDRFARHGLCRSTPSPLDRRTNINTLTATGTYLADRMAEAVTNGRMVLLARLDQHQVADLSHVLSEMIAEVSPDG